MIAYLEKHDTTVDLPDDIGQKDIQDINDNFHSYVDPKPQATAQPAQPNAGQPDSGQTSTPEPQSKWQPNFYESLMRPALSSVSPIIAPGIEAAVQTPGAQAFAGKAVEEGTFGLAKPLIDPLIAQDVKDHPVMAGLGQAAGGLGSLLVTGGALKIVGLEAQAAVAGKGAVEAGFAAGERFIPRAIMTGATFGTRTFIAQTVKAFQDGGVDLEHFGRDVLKDTAFGAMFGTIGGLERPIASISSAGALGFISSKMDGADNREASLNGAIWAAFETVGSVGRSESLRMEALKNLKDSIGEYVGKRDPSIPPEAAQQMASQFVDQTVRKAGFETAEDLAKSGPENLLEGIEKVNQMVRNAQVPAPEEAVQRPELTTPEEAQTSKDVTDFAKQHPEASENDLAQMAHNRGLLEEPNPDLLKMEMQEGKEESPKPVVEKTEPDEMKTEAQMAGTARFPGMSIPKETGETVPAAEAVSSRLKESADEITNLVAPANAAPLAAQITRENLGKMARSYDMAEASLSDAKKFFDSQPKEANLDFIDKMERGQEQSPNNLGKVNSSLQIISKQLRDLLDSKRKEIQALGTGKMQSFIENYFPHIWDQGDKQVSQATMKAAKRPFEGSKGFLKKRSIETTKQGIEAGLTPVSYNPVDLTLLKIREMDKYLSAHRTIKEYKENGLAKYVKIGGDVPEGWQKIDDKISTVFKSPMVAVKEAFDTQMMEGLNKVAKSLGINLERNFHTSEGKGQKADTWGLSFSKAAGEPGKIWTKFAGPESALAHELGHQIDNIHGLQAKFLSDPKIDKELTKLANERAPENATPKFKEYIQKPSEKMAVMMEAYIHAPELFKETAPKTYKKLVDFLKANPKLAPLTEVKPSLQLGSNQGEVYAGGAVIAGHIYAQPDAARIINNYLSPGLQKSAIYQAYRYAGNLINQFQLGFSAFHLGFTSLDATVSKFALGLNELAAGHPIKAIEKALASPFAPIANVIRGDQLMKAWRGEGKNASDDVLAQAMASAGGRARMDQFYATRAYDQMKHHFEAGNLIRGVLHIPLTIAELSSKPILEYIVPRQKLGVFSDMMKMEMENNPNMTHGQVREIAQKAWDSVDNRMGQLVYDNLFWNRTFKDLLMASVRSVGWNLGTIRELAGGAADYVKAASQATQGKKPEFSYRMAYFAALPIVTGILGAMIQYLRTGKGPQEAKDYWYPRTGGTDANGSTARISLPSYMKDLYHYTQAPIKTITNKTSPLISSVAQMLENKDYFGVKIRNEDDPLVKQAASEAEFMLKQITPFSIRNMEQNRDTGNKSLFDTIGPWVGITPAPYDINQTKAEKLAHEIAASHQEIGGRTQEQADRSRMAAQLTRQYRSGDPKAADDLYKAYQDGKISRQQMRNVIVHAGMTPLQQMTHSFSLAEAERVYKVATPEEKGQMERMIQRKEAAQQRQFATTGEANQ